MIQGSSVDLRILLIVLALSLQDPVHSLDKISGLAYSRVRTHRLVRNGIHFLSLPLLFLMRLLLVLLLLHNWNLDLRLVIILSTLGWLARTSILDSSWLRCHRLFDLLLAVVVAEQSN